MATLSVKILLFLLRQATYWHSTADEWVDSYNLLASTTSSSSSSLSSTESPHNDAPVSSSLVAVPPAQVNVVYVLQSAASRVVYIGSTDNMYKRLRQHNAKKMPSYSLDLGLGITRADLETLPLRVLMGVCLKTQVYS